MAKHSLKIFRCSPCELESWSSVFLLIAISKIFISCTLKKLLSGKCYSWQQRSKLWQKCNKIIETSANILCKLKKNFLFHIKTLKTRPHYSSVLVKFKVNNRNTRTRCEICSKLMFQWRCSGIFFANFEHIPHLVLVFLLLSLNM